MEQEGWMIVVAAIFDFFIEMCICLADTPDAYLSCF